MSTIRRAPRLGFTMIELLFVVGILAVVFTLVVPRMTVIKESSSLRAAKQQLVTAFSAARSAALQKGKTSTLTLNGSVATVSVLSGLAGKDATVLGPLRLDQTLGVKLEPIGSAPTSINYDARGLMTPTPSAILRYRLKLGELADTLCISTAGLILNKGCTL